jgi:hypothetical protein
MHLDAERAATAVMANIGRQSAPERLHHGDLIGDRLVGSSGRQGPQDACNRSMKASRFRVVSRTWPGSLPISGTAPSSHHPRRSKNSARSASDRVNGKSPSTLPRGMHVAAGGRVDGELARPQQRSARVGGHQSCRTSRAVSRRLGMPRCPSLRKIFLFPPSSGPGSGAGYFARAMPVGAGEPCTKWLVRNH